MLSGFNRKSEKIVQKTLLNPISTRGEGCIGGRMESSITQKREKIFSSNSVTFVTDKCVTVCTIKLEDRPFQVAVARAKIKEGQK